MAASSNRKTNRRILVVDDNELGSLARRGVLNELGHEVAIATTPEGALELFQKESFDLVVTDYKMPVMDGVELIRQIREIRPQMPVVLLSGFTDTLGLSEQNTGANAVIQKSSNEVQNLIRSVNRLLAAPKKPAASQGSAKAKRKTAE
jgi:CheY-like chemotaxis protein